MNFQKYPHIERLGNDEVDGLLVGTCHVFPKIDGTNASVWWDGESVRCGSRKREITPENDNAGFAAWVQANIGAEFFQEYPDWRLFGEWLVPHSLKTYRDDAWRKFYVFDVMVGEQFLPYEEYQPALEEYGFEVIPLLLTVDNPTVEFLTARLESNTYLIKDGAGFGEGIVVKNYGFVNRYGRTVWAKVVRNEFREQHRKEMGSPEVACRPFELKLAEELVTSGRVQKIIDKMTVDTPWSSRRIPELLGRVWHDVITEELWEVVSRHKNPTIDFRALNNFVIAQIKVVKKELF